MLLVMCWLLSAMVFAQGPATGVTLGPSTFVVGNADHYTLSPAFDVLEDPGGALTLADVLTGPWQERFTPADHRRTADNNFGTSRSAFWLRVQLRGAKDTPTDWLLEVAYPPLDLLDVYQATSADNFVHTAMGDLRDFAARPVAHRNHVVPVTLQAGSTLTLLLRVSTQGALAVPTHLWRPAALAHKDQRDYALLSLYFGLLGGLLLYNVLLYFSVGDRVYLIYVAFVAGLGVTEAGLTGMGAQFLWPEWTHWNSVTPPIGMALGIAFGLSFARSFLSSTRHLPRLDRVMQALIALCALPCVLAPFHYAVASHMVTALAAASVAAVLTAGVLGVKNRHPGARTFLTAWTVLLVSVVILALHNNGVVPSNLFTANALLVGSGLEMVLLSFALADRINQTRAEKDLAQASTAAEHEVVNALRLSQDKLQKTMSEREAILNSALVGIVLSVDRHHQWVNEKFASMLGYTRDELIGESSHLIHPDYAQWQTLGDVARRSLMATGVCSSERQLLRRNGEVFWVLMAGTCVRSHDPDSGVIWTFLDITERKQAEDDTRRALAQQQGLNELRTRFIAMTSHEFRTPLATILSSTELLKYYGERLPAEDKAAVLNSIEAGVSRMTTMLDRVLLISKAQAQMLEFKPQSVDLGALCHGLLEDTKKRHPDTNCRFELILAPDVSRGLFDPVLLDHILGNLLSNAVKYSPDGGVVRLEITQKEAQTLFAVSDQGIGIPASEVDHLFGSFHRASNVGAIAGTGLGLAIVKEAVDLHGGSIGVQSQVGSGTTFLVTLTG